MVDRNIPPARGLQHSDSSDEDIIEASPPPVSRDQLSAWSKLLHRNAPANLYPRIKVPWRTILVSLVFFLIGTVMLIWGVHDFRHKSLAEAYEKFILGLILFIPGSYHTFLAVQALRGVDGWDYQNLTVFESERFFEEE